MRVIFFLCLSLGIVQPVFATIYKYVDKSGVLIFTDNIADVPVEQRENVDRIKEIKSPSSNLPAKKLEVKMQPSPSAVEKKEQDVPLDPNTENLTELQTLNVEKQRLDQEYETLVRQRQELGKNKPDLTDAAKLEAYRKKVMDLNKKIKAFDVKRSAFEKKVAVFNAKNTPSAQ